ncbi:MAG: hypothetical protein F9K31_02475 [Dokdonella sp.]|nr:MAG: hypothetical protein F9K31_02475 [Dokdonella sp.]
MADIDWVSIAAIIASACAVIAAVVCVAMYRRVRSFDVVRRINEGDAEIKRHAEQSLDEIHARIDGMGDALKRIESHQAAEEKYVLRPRDLGAIQDKINHVAEDLAATRAQTTTQTQMLAEQLRLLQKLVHNELSVRRNS